MKRKCKDCPIFIQSKSRCDKCALRHNEHNRKTRKIKRDLERQRQLNSQNSENSKAQTMIDLPIVNVENFLNNSNITLKLSIPQSSSTLQVSTSNPSTSASALELELPLPSPTSLQSSNSSVSPKSSSSPLTVPTTSSSNSGKKDKTSTSNSQTVLLQRISRNVANRISKAIKSQIHWGETTEQLLGTPISEYKSFIETQFEPGMTWDNWGRWSIDHKVPVSSVDLCDPLTRLKVFHYSNTRPLWTDLNLKKSNANTLASSTLSTNEKLIKLDRSLFKPSSPLPLPSANLLMNEIVWIDFACDALSRIKNKYTCDDGNVATSNSKDIL